MTIALVLAKLKPFIFSLAFRLPDDFEFEYRVPGSGTKFGCPDGDIIIRANPDQENKEKGGNRIIWSTAGVRQNLPPTLENLVMSRFHSCVNITDPRYAQFDLCDQPDLITCLIDYFRRNKFQQRLVEHWLSLLKLAEINNAVIEIMDGCTLPYSQECIESAAKKILADRINDPSPEFWTIDKEIRVCDNKGFSMRVLPVREPIFELEGKFDFTGYPPFAKFGRQEAHFIAGKSDPMDFVQSRSAADPHGIGPFLVRYFRAASLSCLVEQGGHREDEIAKHKVGMDAPAFFLMQGKGRLMVKVIMKGAGHALHRQARMAIQRENLLVPLG